MKVVSGKSLHIKPKMMKVIENGLNLITKQIIDFESFIVNGYLMKECFKVQGCMSYFEMLNGPIYLYLIKDLWAREKVFL